MKLTKSAIAALFLSVSFSLPATANIPDDRQLQFDVVRKGKDIGDVSYIFRGNESSFQVQVTTDVAVQVPLLGANLYRFQQSSTEDWRNGKLSSLSSNTNDNGEKHNISAGATQLIPASLWSARILQQSQLLNTVDGSVMAVQFRTVGKDVLNVRGKQIEATHYRISGDLTRDVWFDAKGELMRIQFVAEDGTAVTYVRK